MNFNEFQEAWQKDNGGGEELTLRISALKQAHQPIDSIRKNMKSELYMQLLAIAFLGYAPFFYGITGNLLMVYLTLYALLVAVSGYYFFRFYRFFKSMHNYNASTKDSLYELYYEILLHCEMYKSLTYLLIPFALVIGGIIGYVSGMRKTPGEDLFSGETDFLILPVLAIIVTLLIIAATNWWVKYFYGKHAREIWKILQELKE